MRFSGKIDNEIKEKQIDGNLSILKDHVNKLYNEKSGEVRLTFSKDGDDVFFVLSEGEFLKRDNKFEITNKITDLLWRGIISHLCNDCIKKIIGEKPKKN